MAKEIWEYDAKKLYLAEEKGYNCEVVWETDYNKNKNTILELIKNYGEHKQTHPSMSQN
jgi:G:T-mismatch repair DNA endonuclease (very short patch repair protein)